MNRRLIKGFNNRFAGNRPKNGMSNELTKDARRNRPDNSSVGELIVGLRRKHPKDGVIVKSREALDMAPKRESGEKNIVRVKHLLTTNFVINNQIKTEGAKGAADSWSGKVAANIEKFTTNDFYRAVGSITVFLMSMK